MTSNKVDIGAVGDFVPGTVSRVRIGGRDVAVIRNGDDFFALRDTCPHQGARLSDGQLVGTPLECDVGDPLRYGRCGEILRCPWHGWQFDVTTGHSLFDPQGVRLREYAVRVEGHRVLVEIG